MTKALDIAKALLLKPASLDEANLERLIQQFLTRKVDDADLYFQSVHHESWYLEDSVVKSGSYSIDRGVGIRAVSGEKTGFAYCVDIDLPAMERAADAAQSIARAGSCAAHPLKIETAPLAHYPGLNPIEGLTKKEKIALLESVDKIARKEDPRVIQVNASLTGVYEVVLVAGLEGQYVADIRPLVSMNVSVVVEENGRRESARSGGGGRLGYSFFLSQSRAAHYAKEAVREALVSLKAEAAPAGTMPVILGPGWPGVLLHEAVGHGLEGDFNRKGLSAFSGRMGEQVAAKGVTVVDDGTLKDRRGSL